MKTYDTLVYIGRFQPFHNAHLKTIEIASNLCDQLVIIIGSDNSPRTIKNPFTTSERCDMINNSLKDSMGLNSECNIIIDRCEDLVYDDTRWSDRIKKIVAKYDTGGITGIIGHEKDASSFYLKMFDGWEYYPIERLSDVNATDIRENILDYNFIYDLKNTKSNGKSYHLKNTKYLTDNVPNTVYNYLIDFINTACHEKLMSEFDYISTYKRSFSGLDFPPVFVTVDVLMIVNNKILLIRRNSAYGDGLLALPGGFLDANHDKNILSAMLRELNEETGLNVPDDVIINNLKRVEIFDNINRSERGRIITHVHMIEMGMEYMPDIEAGDDAGECFWYDLKDLNRKDFFEDHYDIIIKMLDL